MVAEITLIDGDSEMVELVRIQILTGLPHIVERDKANVGNAFSVPKEFGSI